MFMITIGLPEIPPNNILLLVELYEQIDFIRKYVTRFK